MIDPEIPDPLREAFDKLEREVRMREQRERQARCKHDSTASLRQVGDATEYAICRDCGAWIILPPDSSVVGQFENGLA